MVDFDAVASQFDAHRALPSEVALLVRDALWQAMGLTHGGLVLEIGAGTGRIGHAFQGAGDDYIGVDLSGGMLDQFVARMEASGGQAPRLAQGNGWCLPFAADTFATVLLVQVLSNVRGWRLVLGDAQRVLRPGGGLALGQTVPPADGVDRRMRDQLTDILTDLGAAATPAGARVSEAVAWLAPQARRHAHLIAAIWEQARTPREFLARRPSGARFASLPREVRAIALARLEAWARATFGTLDTRFIERWAFELNIFIF